MSTSFRWRGGANAQRARLFAWGAGGAVYGMLLTAVCAAVILPGRAGTVSLDARIREVGAEAESAEKEKGAIIGEVESAQSRLRAIRRVTGHPDWSVLLELVSGAREGQIVFDLCELEPAAAKPVAAPPAGGTAAPAAAPAADTRRYILRLNGIGRQQKEIPKFVMRLEDMGLFERVALLESQSRQLEETEVYGFRIECVLRDSGRVDAMSAGIGRMAFWQMDAAALLVIGGATFGAYHFGIEPALLARAQEQSKRQTLGPQEALRDQATMGLRQAKDRLTRIRKELEESPLRLEPVTQINRRLVKITELAAEVGLNLDQVTPGAQAQSTDAVVVALRLTGRGGFPASGAFLSRLHGDFADMAVTGFRLSGNPGSEAGQGLFELDLAWYAASGLPVEDRQAEVPLH